MGSLLSAAVCLCWMGAQSAAPVILDTDLGDDIDDTWALAFVLGTPQVDLKLIVTAFGDTPTKTRLAAKILDRVGRTNVPIGTGVKTGDAPIRQAKWLGDYSLTTYPGRVFEDGVQAMIECIHAVEGPVTLLAIGPQTNLAEALRRDPSIAGKARVVAMAGSVEVGYGGRPGREPEWNVKCDVAAARAVFAAPWEITMAPLDVCGTLVLCGERYARVAAGQTLRAKAVIENYRQWARFSEFPEGQSSVLFDTAAAYLSFDETLADVKTVRLSIDDAGNTVPDETGRRVRCALGWKNRDAFEKLLVDTLTVPD